MASDIAEISEISSILSILTVILCFSAMAVFIIRLGVNPLPTVSFPTVNPVPATAMVGIRNPFTLEISDPQSGSLKNGVKLKMSSEVPFVLDAYWGLEINSMYHVLRHSSAIFQENREETDIFVEEKYLCKNGSHHFDNCEDKMLTLHPDVEGEQLLDLGRPPRTKYPLVVIMSEADQETTDEDEESSKIISMLTAIHLPDRSYCMKSHTIHQLVVTNKGNFCNLEKLFMSTEPSEDGSSRGPEDSDLLTDASADLDTFSCQGKDCTVCQNASISRVILPCRHACVCQQCFPMLNKCPMCRGPIESFFDMYRNPTADYCDEELEEGEDNVSTWITKFENMCERLNRWLGLRH